MNTTRITFDYTLPANVPGADANNYVLFDSTVAGTPKGAISGSGMKVLGYAIDNPAQGTLKLYWSPDRGTTWLQVDFHALAPAIVGGHNTGEFLVEGYPDIRLVWTNGGVAQTGWTIALWLADERADQNAGKGRHYYLVGATLSAGATLVAVPAGVEIHAITAWLDMADPTATIGYTDPFTGAAVSVPIPSGSGITDGPRGTLKGALDITFTLGAGITGGYHIEGLR